jgi:hypothetical protein
MNTQNQREIIIKLLEEDFRNGAFGVNSVYIRNKHFIIDVPTRVFELKKYFKSKGLMVSKRRQRNGTASYYLKKDISSDNPVTVGPLEHIKEAYEYEYFSYQKEGRIFRKEVTEDVEPLLKRCSEHVRYLGESCHYCRMRMEAHV